MPRGATRLYLSGNMYRPAAKQQLLCQRGFTGIRMGDDSECTSGLRGHQQGIAELS